MRFTHYQPRQQIRTITNDNDDNNQPKKSNILRPPFGGKSQTGNLTKTKTDTTTVANIEIKDSQINGGNGGVKIVNNIENHEHNYPPDIKPKRQQVEKRPPLTVEQGGITSENKKIMEFLIDRWVELKKIDGSTSNLYPYIRKRTYEMATSAGIGVTNINEFPDCDFRKAETFLNSQITRVIKDSAAVQEHVKEENRLKGEIHDRFKQLGVGDRDRTNYQKYHYHFSSLTYFNMENLKKLHDAIMQPNPDLYVGVDYFENEELPQGYSYLPVQKQRENVLAEWLAEQQANDKTLDIKKLPYTQIEMLVILQAKVPKDSKLFNITESTFSKFWLNQKLCILKPSTSVKLELEQPKPQPSTTSLPTPQKSSSQYRIGQHVSHESYGKGIIGKVEGEGKTERVFVKFRDDARWLLTAYTELTALPQSR